MMTSGVEPRPKGMRLVGRDFDILLALHTARYLTTQQIERLVWRASRGGTWGRTKACQQRLRRLVDYGLIRRIEQPVKRGERPLPYIYALDRKGADLLVAEMGIEPSELDWRPKAQEENYPFLEHLLTTTDVHIALQLGCEASGVLLADWMDEKELKSAHNVDYVTLTSPSGGQSRAAVVPDGYFKLCREEKCGLFFLEVDLKTVTIAPTVWERRGWMRRIRAYVEYFRSEAYRSKYGTRRARLVTVTSSTLRLQNLKKATEEVFRQLREMGEDATAQNRFWFSLIDESLEPAQLLASPIWQVAGSDELRSLMD